MSLRWTLCVLLLLIGACGVDMPEVESGAAAGFETVPSRYVGSALDAEGRLFRMDLVVEAGGSSGTYSLLSHPWIEEVPVLPAEIKGLWQRQTRVVNGAEATIMQLQPDDGRPGMDAWQVDHDRLRVATPAGSAMLEEGILLHRVPTRRDPASVDMGLGDTRGEVRMKMNQLLRVHLPGSPATGYAWMLEEGATRFLHLERDPGKDVDGAGPVSSGIQTWAFRARRNGVTTLDFGYRRPWEATKEPLQRARFNIRVD